MQYTAEQIARMVGGSVDGDGSVVATRFARIEHGRPGDICFFANPKYERHVYENHCSILLVNNDFVPARSVSATLVRVNDAYTAVSALLQREAAQKRRKGRHRALTARCRLSARLGKGVWLGDFAYVGRRSRVGDGTVISEHVFIGDDVRIGRDCLFHPGVRILDGTVIGDRVIIHPNAVIGSDGFGNAPQDDGSWQKIEHLGNVVIGDDVEIGACTTVDRSEMGSTLIANGVKIDNLCQIAHNVVVGEHTVMAAQTGIAGSTKVGKYCTLGGQVGMVGHLTIADHTQVGAQAGVTHSIRKEGQSLWGTPAMPLRQYLRAYAKFKQQGES